ncbi:MAG TPA: autotransporter-associated beta strand repeat-containing protein, partial [Gemmataceae bacterium]|nr:autotransporter-associated beta strand repeat-containing protein [Gemmataceae bacterium]
MFEVLEDRVVPTAYTWNGGTDGNWATAANWTPSGVPGIADSATFPATLTAAQTIMLPANVTTSVLSINFAQTAAAAIVNITGGLGSSLQTSSITASASVSSVIGAPLIEGTTFLVDVEGSSPLFLNGAISGSAQFKKAGPGTLVLGGVNSFTGFVTVSAGVLSISADANLGSSSATTELILSPSNTVTGTAVLDVTANVTLGSLRRIEVGNFGGDGTIDFSNGSGMVVTNNNLVVSGPLTLLSDVPTATILLMNGTQSISSSVTLASGRILDSVSGAFSGSPVTVAAGGQIEFTKSMSSSTPFTFSGTGNDGRGALVIDGSSTTLTSITLGGDATADYVGPSIGMVTLPKVLGAFRLTLGGAPDSTAATWVFNSTVTA